MNSTQLPSAQMAPKAPASLRVTSSTLSPPSCWRTDQPSLSTGGESGSAAPAWPPQASVAARAHMQSRKGRGGEMRGMVASSKGGDTLAVQRPCLNWYRAGIGLRSRTLLHGPRVGLDVRRRRDCDRLGLLGSALGDVGELRVHHVESDQEEVDEEFFCSHENSGTALRTTRRHRVP